MQKLNVPRISQIYICATMQRNAMVKYNMFEYNVLTACMYLEYKRFEEGQFSFGAV